ncbi:hypothetical protein [Embleya scabrispora]|uniref:hypothetical protein n=1 Tax=Embleya scabrispora TaxID=159449 RepID=UPI00137503AF|nr:hypothetical protein [Embleya scabrispora]
MAHQQPFKAGDLVQATAAGTPPRTVHLRPDRVPWPSSQAGTLVVCDARSAIVVHANSLRCVEGDAAPRGAARPPDVTRRAVTGELHHGGTSVDDRDGEP